MGQTPKTRRDGWTADRQLRFLDALAQTRSVTRAAAAAGMSRESAYRLRSRSALFATLWDRAVKRPALSPTKGHEVERRKSRKAPKIRRNPPKITKWRKWKDPGFHALLKELRELPIT